MIQMSRIDRINEEVMRALSDALRSIKDPRVGGLVSITRCEVTRDLRYAKVYVSVFGTDEQKKDAIRGLRSASGYLRGELARRVKLRSLPELIVIPDDSIGYGAHISGILNRLSETQEVNGDDPH